MRTMLCRDDADIDHFVLAVGLHHKWHGLAHWRGRVVGAERAHVVAYTVIGHRQIVGEVVVLVGVNPDVVAGGIPQYGENAIAAGRVAVAVDVVANLAAEPWVAFVEQPDSIRAGGSSIGHRRGAEWEAAAADLGLHVHPCRGVVGKRVGVGHPVEDLVLAGAGGQQARMVETDARIEDANSYAAAIPGWVRGHELRRARVVDRHVRIVIRRAGAGWGLRSRVDCPSGPRIIQRNDLVQVKRLDAAQPGGGLDLADRNDRANIADIVVAEAHGAAEAGDTAGDRLVGAGFGGDQYGNGRFTLCDRLSEQLAIVLRQLAPTIGGLGGARRQRER